MDKILSDVRAAKASDIRKGTGPRKAYTNSLERSPVESSGGDLHAALMAVGNELQKHHDKQATLASIGVAFHKIASHIAPEASVLGKRKSVGSAMAGGGLFSTPGPDREAV